jgi:hypothetical protein
MRTFAQRCACLAAIALLAGCAELPRTKDAMLTFETVPEGATIFEGGQSLGVAPVTRTYKNDGQAATIKTPEVTAVWPSGAKESFWTMLPAGADRVATIERPKAAPGLQVDLDNAKKVALSKERDAQRAKDATARDIARASQRCKDQMAKGSLATNDC